MIEQLEEARRDIDRLCERIPVLDDWHPEQGLTKYGLGHLIELSNETLSLTELMDCIGTAIHIGKPVLSILTVVLAHAQQQQADGE